MPSHRGLQTPHPLGLLSTSLVACHIMGQLDGVPHQLWQVFGFESLFGFEWVQLPLPSRYECLYWEDAGILGSVATAR